MLAVFDFEHYLDEGVERRLLQPLEVGRHVIRQAVDTLVGIRSLQKILHPSVSFSSNSVQVLPSG